MFNLKNYFENVYAIYEDEENLYLSVAERYLMNYIKKEINKGVRVIRLQVSTEEIAYIEPLLKQNKIDYKMETKNYLKMGEQVIFKIPVNQFAK